MIRFFSIIKIKNLMTHRLWIFEYTGDLYYGAYWNKIWIQFQKLECNFKNGNDIPKIEIKFLKLGYNSKNWNTIPKIEMKFQKLEYNSKNGNEIPNNGIDSKNWNIFFQ